MTFETNATVSKSEIMTLREKCFAVTLGIRKLDELTILVNAASEHEAYWKARYALPDLYVSSIEEL